MDEGALVPDRIIVDLVLDEISRRGNNNVLLDGFPRTLNQAEVLNKSLHINVVVNLDVPHEVIMQRMANRWIHFPSGRTYAYDYNPPKTIGNAFKDLSVLPRNLYRRFLGFDDVTNEPLSQREDDKPEVVKKRLVHYETATKPLINYYQNLKNCDFASFTGTESDVIYPQVFNYLKSKF